MPELPEELAKRPPRKPGQSPSSQLTLDAYLRLKAELDDLKGRGRDDMAKRLEIAREHGDLKENAEYDEAKNAQGLMEAKIRSLDERLRDPEIVEAPTDAAQAGPGVIVTVKPIDDDDEDEEVYLLAEAAEERAKGARTVTTTSPLGTALMGAKPGDEVAYQAPGGKFTYRVISLAPHQG